MAFGCFEYAALRTSQNALAFALRRLVKARLPPRCTPLFGMDRGSARVALLAQLRQAGIPYLSRGRRGTMVRLKGQRLAVGRVPHRSGVAVRYPPVLYQSTKRERVDLILFHDPAFKAPWYLLVPPDSAGQLPAETVGALYRQRMHIELTFRDWKTHLGIRGLRLEVDIAPRLERLLLALTVASTLAGLLGAGPAARRVRADCALLRATPRHGTRRRLSALSVGWLLLPFTRFAALAARALTRLLAALARGTPAVARAVCPPESLASVHPAIRGGRRRSLAAGAVRRTLGAIRSRRCVVAGRSPPRSPQCAASLSGSHSIDGAYDGAHKPHPGKA